VYVRKDFFIKVANGLNGDVRSLGCALGKAYFGEQPEKGRRIRE
jgi:hypothetical protein